MTVWGELIEAYHGVNGFGGDTAEIYAYRLQGYSPHAHDHRNEKKLSMQARKAASALVAICCEFMRHYEAQLTIDGLDKDRWYAENSFGRFNHRAHVKIWKE